MKNIFKNPYINSVLAEAYIIIVVTVINFIGKPNTPDTVYDSIAAISMFVLSAAVMGFLFLGEPIMLYLNGDRKQAVSFFAKTVACFAFITVLAIIILKIL